MRGFIFLASGIQSIFENYTLISTYLLQFFVGGKSTVMVTPLERAKSAIKQVETRIL